MRERKRKKNNDIRKWENANREGKKREANKRVKEEKEREVEVELKCDGCFAVDSPGASTPTLSPSPSSFPSDKKTK